jgi:hypothetical protein
MGFTLGVPGRGGASGNVLRRLGGCEEKDGGGGGRLSEPASPPTGGAARAGAEGVFGSEVVSTFGDDGVPELGAAPNFRLTGGGGGLWELRTVPASMSSINASGSTSDSSLGSTIICATTLARHDPVTGLPRRVRENITFHMTKDPRRHHSFTVEWDVDVRPRTPYK